MLNAPLRHFVPTATVSFARTSYPCHFVAADCNLAHDRRHSHHAVQAHAHEGLGYRAASLCAVSCPFSTFGPCRRSLVKRSAMHLPPAELIPSSQAFTFRLSTGAEPPHPVFSLRSEHFRIRVRHCQNLHFSVITTIYTIHTPSSPFVTLADPLEKLSRHARATHRPPSPHHAHTRGRVLDSFA